MKKYLFCIIFFCMFFISCNQLIQENKLADDKAYITISFEDYDARTIYPYNFYKKKISKLSFYLRPVNETEYTLVGEWKDPFVSSSSIQDIPVNLGTYDFYLELFYDNDSTPCFYAEELNYEIYTSYNTVRFNAEYCKTGKGKVDIDVKWSNKERVDHAMIELTSLASENEGIPDYTFEYSNETFNSNSFDFIEEDIESGKYLLALSFFDFNNQLIYVYHDVLVIRPGLTSDTISDSAYIYISNMNSQYAVNLEFEEGAVAENGEEVPTLIYKNELEIIDLPVLKKEGYYFVGWYRKDKELVSKRDFITTIKSTNGSDVTVCALMFPKNMECTVEYLDEYKKFIPSEEFNIKITNLTDENLSTLESFLYNKNNEIQVYLDLSDSKITKIGSLGYKSLYGIIFPEEIEELSSSEFFGCKNLKSVVLPKKITEIPVQCFKDCINLESVVLKEGIKTIGSSAFYNCSSLKNIELPSTVEEINYEAFGKCSSLTKFVLTESINRISYDTFDGCSSLFTFDYGTSKKFFNLDFNGCTTLKEIVIPDTITDFSLFTLNIKCPTIERIYWKSNKFCSGLFENTGNIETGVELIIDDSVKQLYCSSNYYVQNYKNNITKVTFGENSKCKLIGKGAFKDYSNLKELILPASLEVIETQAFSRCTGLEKIIIPENVKEIYGAAFMDCTNATYLEFNAIDCEEFDTSGTMHIFNNMGINSESGLDVVIGEKVKRIPDYFLMQKNRDDDTLFKVSSVVLKNIDACEYIGSYAFAECDALTEITIGENVSQIGNYAFKNCYNVEKINLYSKNTLKGKGIFSNVGYKTRYGADVIIGKMVPEISYQFFSGSDFATSVSTSYDTASRLRKIIFEEGSICSYIGENAFGYTYAKEVNIPASVTYISFGAFRQCSFTNVVFEVTSGWQFKTKKTYGDEFFKPTVIDEMTQEIFIQNAANSYGVFERI